MINTWPLTTPTEAAFAVLNRGAGGNPIDAVVAGCEAAESDPSVTSVGFGGSPDEAGNTTLDAMLMDGDTMEVCGWLTLLIFNSGFSQVKR